MTAVERRTTMPPVRKAVIPAAGLGTRFLPASKAQPKEMLPLVDKPAIQYVVEECVRVGITDILVITGRGKRSLEDHFDRSFELEHELMRSGKQDLLKEMQEIADLADMGRYVFSPAIFDILDRVEPGHGGEIQLTDGIRQLMEVEGVYGYTFEKGRFDVGNKLDYLRATVELALERDDLGPPFRAWLADYVKSHGIA